MVEIAKEHGLTRQRVAQIWRIWKIANLPDDGVRYSATGVRLDHRNADIKRLRSEGESVPCLSKTFGLSQAMVYNIINERRHPNRYEEWHRHAIGALGGKCCQCGFDDMRALQIDHVNGGGQREIEKIGGFAIYRKIAMGDTKGYQCLCANCNWIKRHENKEYHRKGAG